MREIGLSSPAVTDKNSNSAGRYEYRNKGADMFIEALARLNKKLMDEQSDITGKLNFFFGISITSFQSLRFSFSTEKQIRSM